MDYEKIAESVQMPGMEPETVVAPEDTARVQKEYLSVNHPKYQGLAADKGYDQSNPLSRLQKVGYTHEAMIDVIISNPEIKQNDLARMFDRSVPWISRIIGSDAFQAALAKRREDLTDPFLIATIEERVRGLAYQSLDIIADKLESTKNVDIALKALDVSVKVLGFGARSGGPTQNNQFVIQLPPKSASAGEWAETHSPMKQVGGA